MKPFAIYYPPFATLVMLVVLGLGSEPLLAIDSTDHQPLP